MRFRDFTSVVLLFVALCSAVLVPFAIWGESLDAALPAWLSSQADARWIAAVGFFLLVSDVLLPVPSSIVSIALCFLLGPALGGLVVFAGMSAAFLFGYAVGALVSRFAVNRWVATATWQIAARRLNEGSLFWLAATRPIPVLAEVNAVAAGILRLPLGRAMAHVAIADALVALAYALAARIGLGAADASPLALVAVAALLPGICWYGYRLHEARERRARESS